MLFTGSVEAVRNEYFMSSTIREFPLVWRWTNPAHAVFSTSELEGLQPCISEEASRIYDQSRAFDGNEGLDESKFEGVRVHSADVPLTEGCEWLRAQSQKL